MSGVRSPSTAPAGSFAKAALVGAKTVKGPGPDRVSTRPAAFTAATSVVWSAEFIAFSMIFLVGNISAPPTVTVAVVIVGERGAVCAAGGIEGVSAAIFAAAARCPLAAMAPVPDADAAPYWEEALKSVSMPPDMHAPEARTRVAARTPRVSEIMKLS
jgi:hypothetical protein